MACGVYIPLKQAKPKQEQSLTLENGKTWRGLELLGAYQTLGVSALLPVGQLGFPDYPFPELENVDDAGAGGTHSPSSWVQLPKVCGFYLSNVPGI